MVFEFIQPVRYYVSTRHLPKLQSSIILYVKYNWMTIGYDNVLKIASNMTLKLKKTVNIINLSNDSKLSGLQHLPIAQI